MRLDEAADIRLGKRAVSRVMLGDTQVWPVSGKGAGAVSIEADPNEGCDRSAEVTVAAAEGPSATLTVTQAGRREPFGGSDMDFILSDGGTFNVLKTNQM